MAPESFHQSSMRSLIYLIPTLLCVGTTFAQPRTGFSDSRYMKHADCGPGQLRDRADNDQCKPYTQIIPGTLYYLDCDQGNDGNDGLSPSRPKRSWKGLKGKLASGDGVIFLPGTCREEIDLPVSNLWLVAQKLHQAIVTGADIHTAPWTARTNPAGWTYYETPYSTSYGIACPWADCSDEAWTRWMVIADGKVLQYENTLSDFQPGSFQVDNKDAPRVLRVRFPADKPPNRFSMIETAERPFLLRNTGDNNQCNATDLGGHHIIGLRFRYASNPHQRAAVCVSRWGVSFEENIVEWTNGVSVKSVSYKTNTPAQAHIIRGNILRYGGHTNIDNTSDYVTFEYNDVLYGNWKHHNLGFAGGAGKWTDTDHGKVMYNYFFGNEGPNFWFDIRNRFVEFAYNRIDSVAGKGLMLEMGTHAFDVHDNIITRVRDIWFDGSGKDKVTDGVGILSQASSRHNIYHNTIIDTDGAGIWIRRDSYNNKDSGITDCGAGNLGRLGITNASCKYYDQSFRGTDGAQMYDRSDGFNNVYNNIVVRNAQGTNSSEKYSIDIEGASASYLKSNRLDGNIYWDNSSGAGSTFRFHQYDSGTDFRSNSLTEWQTRSGWDLNSRIVSASTPVVQDFAREDGYLLSATSVARGAAVELPESITLPALDFAGNPRPRIGADVGALQYSSTLSGNHIPTASFTALSLAEFFPTGFSFDASGSSDDDGSILSYSWDFGDGITANGILVRHTYSMQGEYTVTLVVTDNSGASASTTQTISASGLIRRERVLSKGWNSVSLLVQPQDSSIENVLANVLSQVVLVENEVGEVFSPRYEIDAIGTWNTTEAYHIFCDTTTILAVEGNAISPELVPIPLEKGWNIVPYFRATAMPVTEALNSIAANALLVKDLTGRVYYPELGINDIGELQPGQGYHVFMTEAATLLYPSNSDQHLNALETSRITFKNEPTTN